ncbi:MAG: hypothetical protein KC656_18215, partial [Myxococcales bacterium]|nr:hypothetical protein [Myxococcales bacterium]
MTPLAMPATCFLALAEVELEAEQAGWRESGTYEAIAESRCPWVDVVVPPGASVVSLQARVRLSDGGRRRVDDERMEVMPREADGSGRIRLHTPDALAGDTVHVRLVRELPASSYIWDPAANRGRYSSLTSTVPFVWDGSERADVWVADASTVSPVAVPHPSPVE